MEVAVSKPNLSGFIPFGYQCDVLRFIQSHNYGLFTPEILLSGSVGSAKSILLAHIAIRHCIEFPGSCVAIGRRSLPDLKKTLFREILEHLEDSMVEGEHFTARTNSGEIDFINGSRILSVTWGDQRYAKFRSLKLSMVLIEELTENDDEFESGFKILKARLRRIPQVTQNLLIAATNPDEPDSFWYKYFIEGSERFQSRKVFYSVTSDNPYLDRVYTDQLLQDYSLLEAERYLRGRWISIAGKGIYHAYSEENNFLKRSYEPDKTYPLRIAFDFNTAEGKPQSCAVFQLSHAGIFHFYQESIIDDAKWCIDNLDDLEAKGVFQGFQKFIIYGDATGRARSSNSLRSNYELIEEWFAQRRLHCQLAVPRTNPPLVRRWTTVNAMCQNAKNEVRLFVYKDCPVLNQGMKLARKKEGTSIEDDSKRYQHVTTAIGYAICHAKDEGSQRTKVIHL
jgi:PBSX family phage terminase large subunit